MYSCTLTFQTLLGSFVQRTRRTTSPLNLHIRSRCFASAKILLFPFHTTLFEKKFHLFHSFSLSAVSQRFAKSSYRQFAFFMPDLLQKNAFFWQISRCFLKKNITNRHKKQKNMNGTVPLFLFIRRHFIRQYTRISTNLFIHGYTLIRTNLFIHKYTLINTNLFIHGLTRISRIALVQQPTAKS